jgi:hypothetical protein
MDCLVQDNQKEPSETVNDEVGTGTVVCTFGRVTVILVPNLCKDSDVHGISAHNILVV